MTSCRVYSCDKTIFHGIKINSIKISFCSTANPYKADKNSYYCDRNLLLSLVYDAKATEWFAQQIPPNPSTKDPTE